MDYASHGPPDEANSPEAMGIIHQSTSPYEPPMHPMMFRALNQRQNQSPMRFAESKNFFEAGTHGQEFSTNWPDSAPFESFYSPSHSQSGPDKQRPKAGSAGRIHPTQSVGDSPKLEKVETVDAPRRADMQAANMGRGGRRRGDYRSGNPRDDLWWRLHEGVGEGALFDEDPEETRDTHIPQASPRDPLWKNYEGSGGGDGGGSPKTWGTPPTAEELEERDKNQQQRQEAGRAQLANQMKHADPVGGQRRIHEQIDAEIRKRNPEVFAGKPGYSSYSAVFGPPLVTTGPVPQPEGVPFRHPGGPYFNQGTQGMWNDRRVSRV